MPIDLIFTTMFILITLVTLVTLTTNLLIFLSDLYVDKYSPSYPSHKVYRGRWNSNNKFLHDGRDMLNPYGWDSACKPDQLPLEDPHQTLVFPCHWSHVHPGIPIRADMPNICILNIKMD